MTGVNIFGTGINSTPISQLRGPPGIGFRYLDAEKNFDLNNRRLANISCPIEDKDAVCKTYVDEEVAKVSDVHVKDSEMINKKIDVVREGVMMHINFLEKELPAVKSIVETLDEKVTTEVIEVNSKLETLEEEVKTIREKLKKQMENLVSLNEKVSSLEGIQVEIKAFIDEAVRNIASNKNELAEVLRIQDQLFERLRKIERQ
jgi:chromosome segregation ATPase